MTATEAVGGRVGLVPALVMMTIVLERPLQGETLSGSLILPSEWGAHRAQVIDTLTMAYDAIAQGRADNYALWRLARKRALDTVQAAFRSVGLENAPMYEDAIWAKVAPITCPNDKELHAQYVTALLTDYTERLWDHCQYRLATDGNVHLYFGGKTGMAKSSCAISLADAIKQIDPAKLSAHINFDLNELFDKLQDKKRGDTVIQDEFISQAGEGAKTSEKLFANLEDTIRKYGVNLFVISPRDPELATSQATLEAIMWNPDEKWTLFLCWTDGVPRGVVALPWCRATLWEPYSRIKEANVKRSISGAFQDREWLKRTAARVLADEKIIDYLKTMVRGREITTKDIRGAMRQRPGVSMAVVQEEAVAQQIADWVRSYAFALPKFVEWYGIEPPKGLREIAKKQTKIDKNKTDNEEEEE